MAQLNLGAHIDLEFPATGLSWRLGCVPSEVLEGCAAGGARQAGTPARMSQRPRVLVVEDETLVAIEVAHAVTEAGFDVLGPARNVQGALELLNRSSCDAAVLDINLGRETSEAIAIALTANKTPFVTLSGYSSEQQHPAFAGAPALKKPLRLQFLVEELKKCIEQELSRTCSAA
jgi:DNA-binding response OmpR family regulator